MTTEQNDASLSLYLILKKTRYLSSVTSSLFFYTAIQTPRVVYKVECYSFHRGINHIDDTWLLGMTQQLYQHSPLQKDIGRFLPLPWEYLLLAALFCARRGSFLRTRGGSGTSPAHTPGVPAAPARCRSWRTCRKCLAFRLCPSWPHRWGPSRRKRAHEGSTCATTRPCCGTITKHSTRHKKNTHAWYKEDANASGKGHTIGGRTKRRTTRTKVGIMINRGRA